MYDTKQDVIFYYLFIFQTYFKNILYNIYIYKLKTNFFINDEFMFHAKITFSLQKIFEIKNFSISQ